ncbi:MAG: amidohydrolase, partial [Chloroflexia bacterium]
MTRSLLLSALISLPLAVHAQTPLAPSDSGQKQGRLVIANALVIDGSGTPANGPRSIVIEGNRITSVTPGVARTRAGDKVIDAKGKYVVPGFINLHGHIQDERAGYPMRQDYQFQLWLASGITSIRDVGSNFEKSKAWRTQSQANSVA